MKNNWILGTLIFVFFVILAYIFGQVAFHFNFAWYWIVLGVVGFVTSIILILSKL